MKYRPKLNILGVCSLAALAPGLVPNSEFEEPARPQSCARNAGVMCTRGSKLVYRACMGMGKMSKRGKKGKRGKQGKRGMGMGMRDADRHVDGHGGARCPTAGLQGLQLFDVIRVQTELAEGVLHAQASRTGWRLFAGAGSVEGWLFERGGSVEGWLFERICSVEGGCGLLRCRPRL
jgi:hypothetical protein